MYKIPRFFGIHAEPGMKLNWILTLVPFILLISAYLYASHLRLQENPADKLMPSVSKMIDSVKELAFEPHTRTGEYTMLADTLASLKRIGIGVSLSAICALLLGLNIGLFPGLRATSLGFVTVVSIIPPLAILPILFITFGVGETGKIALIFLGTCWMMTRDTYLAVSKIPREQIIKALTLGASQVEVVYRVVMPQIIPRLLDSMRLCLGAAWLFLIAAEAIASTNGLGYRIFLVRRYLAMHTIIPYVIWITFLGFSMDFCLRKFIAWRYSWYLVAKD